MSASLWAYCPAYCDSDYCPGDCDRCPKAQVSETNIVDEEEIYTNCTVQILRNSVTGEESIGWWQNEEESG